MELKKNLGIILVLVALIIVYPADVNAEEVNIINIEKEEAFLEFEDKNKDILNNLLITDEERCNKAEQVVNKLVYDLNEINPKILDDVEIITYPFWFIPSNNDGCCRGTAYKHGEKYIIRLSLSGCEEETLYHELGHIISYKIANINGYDWSEVNENGEKYIKLKGYKIKDITGKSQGNLPWEDRISEWIAEDIKQVIQIRKGGSSTETCAGTKLVKEVEELITELIVEL